MTGNRRIFRIALLAIAVQACSDGSVTVKADGRKFRIPKEFAVTSIPFWLPRLRRNEFLFVLNPGEEISQQISVSGEPRSQQCEDQRTPYLRQLCASYRFHLAWSQFDYDSLKKVDEGYGVTWHYEAPVKVGQKIIPILLAYCSGIAGQPRDGLCSSDGFFDGLAYTIGFRESRLSDLPKFHRDVQAKLREWEVS